MVAQHYRWDFIGLSTDSKPDSSNPKVANGSTYYESDTSKLYVWYNNEWYEKTATGGGGYELPIASSSTLGGVKVGENLTIDAEGILSAIGGGGGSTIARTLTEDDLVNGNFDLFELPSGVYVVPKMENVKVYTDDQHYYWTNNQLAIVSNNESSLTADIIFLSQDYGVLLLSVSTAGGYAYSRGTIATSTDISALEARISALEGN